MYTLKVKKEEFVELLVDCQGYSKEDAENLAEDYQNDLGSFITDIGGDDHSIESAKAYLGHE